MSIIICPNCKSVITPEEKTYRCPEGHAFDISKDGYINLLLPNQKKKLNPGDNKAMINARDLFLQKGHYDFLLDHIDLTISTLGLLKSNTSKSHHLLDIGCGTGYYTRRLFNKYDIIKTGLDISKEGVSKASKKDKKNTYVVGSAFNLPIADNSVDLVLNIFAPADLTEVNRVLKTDGVFIKVIPEGNHMEEVANLVYDTFIPHKSTIESELEKDNGFEVLDSQQIGNSLTLASTDIQNLITMTPYFYKFNKEDIDKLQTLSVSLSFKVIIIRKL